MNSEILQIINKVSKVMFLGIFMPMVCYSFSIAEGSTQQNNNENFEKKTKNDLVIQSRNITGRVTSYEDGEGLPGVNIVEKGTNNGVVTDVDGAYSLNVNEGATLVFSSVGYVSEEIEVNDRTVIDLVMTMNIQELNELVVVGYGVQEKKLVTGATTQVKGEDIQKLSTVSPYTAMQSQTPGLSIVANSSRPDADFKVNIRGLGTIGNAEPLIVINGIIGGDLNSISPFDIESIDILKDAASAAIYGSRAANGVILITTKQGKPGKPTITYDMNYGVQNVDNYLDMVNAEDYMMLVNESIVNSGGTPFQFTSILPNDIAGDLLNGWQGTNWWQELTNQNAPVQNHGINITGGSDMSTYAMGVTYTGQEAILGQPLTEKFNRISFRLNSDHVLLKKNDRPVIKVGQNLLYTQKKRSNRMASDWRWAASHPLIPVYNEDGDFYNPVSFDADRINPVGFQNYNSQNGFKSSELNANVYLEIEPIQSLKFRSNFGFNTNNSNRRQYYPEFNLGPSHQRLEDEVRQEMSESSGYQLANTLSYDFQINNAHNFSVMLGQSLEENNIGINLYGGNTGSLFDDYEFAYLTNVKNVNPGKTWLGGEPYVNNLLSSFFGRLNYDYQGTYLFTAIIRRDGSSNFARGNRWGNFPSFSAGWVINNESFMDWSANWLDFLKLRASWGQNGNQNIPNFQYLTTYSFSNAFYSFGTSKDQWSVGAYPSQLANQNVTWETSEQLNIGLDMRFFKGSLEVNVDAYDKITKNWLLRAPILATHGARAPFINGGDVANRGLEIALNWRNNINELYYRFSANVGLNKNEVTRIANNEGVIEGQQVSQQATGQLPPYRAQVGFPIGYFWGYETAGVFQNEDQISNFEGPTLGSSPGDLIFVNQNDDDVIDAGDRVMIGDPNPFATLGFSMSFDYKGFDFSATAAGVMGNDIMISHRIADAFKEHYPSYYLNRWHGEGTSNRLPRLTSTPSPNYTRFSDIYLEPGDYLRIQNITLGYDFKNILPSIPMEKARVYVSALNLHTFTGYKGANPEVGFAPSNWAKGIDVQFNPLPVTYMVGANLSF